MNDRAYEELIENLSIERHAILTGNLADLVEIGARNETLIGQVAQDTLLHGQLFFLQSKLAHNQALILAAVSGMETANQRLAELATVKAGLSTYQQDGKVSRPTPNPNALEKRL